MSAPGSGEPSRPTKLFSEGEEFSLNSQFFMTSLGLFVFPVSSGSDNDAASQQDHPDGWTTYQFSINDTIFGERGGERPKMTGHRLIKCVCDFDDWFILGYTNQTESIGHLITVDRNGEPRVPEEVQKCVYMSHYPKRTPSETSIIARLESFRYASKDQEFKIGRPGHGTQDPASKQWFRLGLWAVSDRQEQPTPWPPLSESRPPGQSLQALDIGREVPAKIVVSPEAVFLYFAPPKDTEGKEARLPRVELIHIMGRYPDGSLMYDRRVINRAHVTHFFVHFLTPTTVVMVEDSLVTMIDLFTKARFKWILLSAVEDADEMRCFVVNNNRLYLEFIKGGRWEKMYVIGCSDRNLRILDEVSNDDQSPFKWCIRHVFHVNLEKGLVRIAVVEKPSQKGKGDGKAWLEICEDDVPQSDEDTPKTSKPPSDIKVVVRQKLPELIKSDGWLVAKQALMNVDDALAMANADGNSRDRKSEICRDCIARLWKWPDEEKLEKARETAVVFLTKLGKLGKRGGQLFDGRDSDWVEAITTKFLHLRAERGGPGKDDYYNDHLYPNPLDDALIDLLYSARRRCTDTLKSDKVKKLDVWITQYHIYFHQRAKLKQFLQTKIRDLNQSSASEKEDYEKEVEQFLEAKDKKQTGESSRRRARILFPEAIIFSIAMGTGKNQQIWKMLTYMRKHWELLGAQFNQEPHGASFDPFSPADEAVEMISRACESSEKGKWLKRIEQRKKAWFEEDRIKDGIKLLMPNCIGREVWKLSKEEKGTKTTIDRIRNLATTDTTETDIIKLRIKLWSAWVVATAEAEPQKGEFIVRCFRELIRSLEVFMKDAKKEGSHEKPDLDGIEQVIRVLMNCPSAADAIQRQGILAHRSTADRDKKTEEVDLSFMETKDKIRLLRALRCDELVIQELKNSSRSDSEIRTECLESERPEDSFKAYLDTSGTLTTQQPAAFFSMLIKNMDSIRPANLTAAKFASRSLGEVAPVLLSLGQAVVFNKQAGELLQSFAEIEKKERDQDALPH